MTKSIAFAILSMLVFVAAAASQTSLQKGDGSQALPPKQKPIPNVEILGDSEGVDFGSYLQTLIKSVHEKWYAVMPETAKKPEHKHGHAVVDFNISKGGDVSPADVKVTLSSGDPALDSAALTAIQTSAPFKALPSDYHGAFLRLRIHFWYNPTSKDLEQVPPKP